MSCTRHRLHACSFTCELRKACNPHVLQPAQLWCTQRVILLKGSKLKQHCQLVGYSPGPVDDASIASCVPPQSQGASRTRVLHSDHQDVIPAAQQQAPPWSPHSMDAPAQCIPQATCQASAGPASNSMPLLLRAQHTNRTLHGCFGMLVMCWLSCSDVKFELLLFRKSHLFVCQKGASLVTHIKPRACACCCHSYSCSWLQNGLCERHWKMF